MHETIQKMARAFAKQREQRRRACAGFTALAILVSISTTYLLVRPANTLAADYYCGYEAHIHTEECFERVLICGYDTEEDGGAIIVPGGDGGLVEWLPPEEEIPEEIPPVEGEIPEGMPPVEGEVPEVIPPVEGEIPAEGEAPEVTPPAEETPAEPPVEEIPAEPPVEEVPSEEPVAPEVTEPEAPVEEPEAPVEETPAEEPKEEVTPEVPAASEPAADESNAPAESETLTASSIQYDEAPAESGSSEDSAPAESGSSEPAPAPKEESKPAEAPKTEEPKAEEPAAPAETPSETPSEEPSAPAETPSQEPAAPAEPSEPAEGEEPEAPAEGEETETPAESETPAEGETPSEEVPSEGGEPPVEGEAPVEGAEPEGHVHTEDCYEYVLICELPEHTHTELCLPQSMMQLLPEGAEIPEGYDNEYSYVDADAGFAVAVYAPDGALPEDAELVAELLEEGSDAHATAAQTLEAMAAQEVAVNVGGVMPESALEEAAENADPDVEYIVEEEPEAPEEEEMGQAPEEPAAPAEPEDGAETSAETPEAPEASEPEAPVEEPEVPEVTEPEAPAEEPEVEEPAEEPAEEPEEEPAEDESPAESETLTASSIQYDENPADEAPAEEPVVEAPVAEEEPVEEPIVEETPVEEPAEEPVVEEPVVEGPVDETPIEEPVTEGIPAEEVPEEEAVEEEEVVEEAEPVPYEGEFKYDGFVALDIHFELDGEEIEPTKPVFVCINVKGLLPETADPESVMILHLKETDDIVEETVEEVPAEEITTEEVVVEEAEVSLMAFEEEPNEAPAFVESVEVVADSTATTGVVEAAKSDETYGLDVATFFAVDSFSIFVSPYTLRTDAAAAVINMLNALPSRADITAARNYESAQYNEYFIDGGKGKGYEAAKAYAQYAALTNEDKETVKNATISVNGTTQNLLTEKLWHWEDIWYKCIVAKAGDVLTEDDIRASVGKIDFNLYDYSNLINKNTNGSWRALVTKNLTFQSMDGNGANQPDTKEVAHLAKDSLHYDRTLSGGYPSLGGVSLDYLFSNGDPYVTAYENVENPPLSFDGVYYSYSSKDHAVDFDVNTNELYVRSYLERGLSAAKASGGLTKAGDYIADFFPFNAVRIDTSTGEVKSSKNGDYDYHYSELLSARDYDYPNYWFGASMDARFYYPVNGFDESGEQMVFEFSGDDDVLVYIDGVLVMDLGGAHSRADGSINFHTGLVETYLNSPSGEASDYNNKEAAKAAAAAAGGKTNPSDKIRYYPTTIYDCFAAAGVQNLDQLFVKVEGEKVADAYGNEHDVYRFKDYSLHTFDWFYMERYCGQANFNVKFNLPVLPDRGLTVSKAVTGAELLGNKDYTFQLLHEGAPYEMEGTENGIFTLQAGSEKTFDGIPVTAGNFSVRELIPVNEDKEYASVDLKVNGAPVDIVEPEIVEIVEKIDEETTVTKQYYAYTSPEKDIEDSPSFAFTNNVAAGSLTIDKDVYVAGTKTDGATFTFDLICAALADKEIGGVEFDETGKATVSVTAGSSTTISGLPAGAQIQVTETNYDGYAPSWSHDDATYTNGAVASAVTIPAGDTATVYFRNTTGPALPNTGGMGTHIYTVLGVTLMLGAGVLLLNQRRRKEADSVT